MGAYTYVTGFKPPDERWRQMKAVWDACTVAGVELPPGVVGFFNGYEPDDAGVEIDQEALEGCSAIRKWRDGMREGFEVDISRVPADVKIIRFVNSY
jgi:hypothetical protein